MGLYGNCILPCLLHVVMRQGALRPFRERVAQAAEGRVLEIGVGSGLNLPLYRRGVSQVTGIDPSAPLLGRARRAAAMAPLPVELIEGSAEALPFGNGSFDTVVTTWSLCTIPDAGRALAEARRVLRPGGSLLFVEHGRAPDPAVARWQDRLDPLWRRVAGGCHLNRPVGRMIAEGGFRIDRLATTWLPGPSTHTFLSEGRARPR